MRQKLNLKNKIFGRLKVIERVANNPNLVVCQCQCGNICTVRVTNLTKSATPTRSCGCLRREKSRQTGARTIHQNTIHSDGMNKMFNTIFHMIENPTLHKNNMTGHRGVYLNKKNGKYIAKIGLHNKLHYIGSFNTIEEAIKARLNAEDEMYAPLIAEKNAILASKSNQ